MNILHPGGATATVYGMIETVDVPSFVYSDSLNFSGWFSRGSSAGATGRTALLAQNLLMIWTTNTVARLSIIVDGAGAITTVDSATFGTSLNGQRFFIAGSWDRATGAIIVVCRTATETKVGTGTKVAAAHTAGRVFWGKHKESGDGSSGTLSTAWNGEIGGMVLRSGALTQAQLEGICAAAWTEIPGQAGRYDPTVPLMYAGSGYAGPRSKLIAFNVDGSQDAQGTGAVDGARIGGAVADGHCVWIYNDGSHTSNNDVENNVFSFRRAVTITGAMTYAADDPAFFGIPSPDLGTDGNNGVASNFVRRMKARAPSGVERIACLGNSRAVDVTGYAGGPSIYGTWSGNHASGLAGHFSDLLGGFANVAPNTAAQAHPIFPFATAPRQSGSFLNTSSGGGLWSDFSRLWTNSTTSTSTGTGRITVFASSGATLTQRATLNPDTLFDGATQFRWRAAFIGYPGHPGSLTWKIEDAENTADAGVEVTNGSVTGMDTTVATHTYSTTNDGYNVGTKTLALLGFDASGLSAGMVVHTTTSHSLAEIVTVTPGASATIVLKDVLKSSPANGESLRFGPVTYPAVDVTVDAPTGDNVCQGFSVTANNGGLWPSYGAEAVGVDCIVPGTMGATGHGFAWQLENCNTGVIREVIEACGFTAALFHGGTQNSTTIEHYEAMAALTELPTANTVFVGDMVHKISDTTLTGSRNTEMLAQTIRPAIVATNKSGSLAWAIGAMKRRDVAHPAIEQHVEHFANVFGTASDGIPVEPILGIDTGPVLAAGDRFRQGDRFRTRDSGSSSFSGRVTHVSAHRIHGVQLARRAHRAQVRAQRRHRLRGHHHRRASRAHQRRCAGRQRLRAACRGHRL